MSRPSLPPPLVPVSGAGRHHLRQRRHNLGGTCTAAQHHIPGLPIRRAQRYDRRTTVRRRNRQAEDVHAAAPNHASVCEFIRGRGAARAAAAVRLCPPGLGVPLDRAYLLARALPRDTAGRDVDMGAWPHVLPVCLVHPGGTEHGGMYTPVPVPLTHTHTPKHCHHKPRTARRMNTTLLATHDDARARPAGRILKQAFADDNVAALTLYRTTMGTLKWREHSCAKAWTQTLTGRWTAG